MWVAAAVLGCGQPAEERMLVLDGPAKVRVEQLGVVAGPAARLSDGSAAEGVEWTVTPAQVAVVKDGVVEAIAPGEATITGAWKGQTASWRLTVSPAVTLVLRGVPEKLLVGESKQIEAHQRLADGFALVTSPVTWVVSDPSRLTIGGDGLVTGVAPGVVYVSASAAGGDAMAEIEVVAP